MTQHPLMINTELILGPFLAFITHIYPFFDKRSDNLHCQDGTVSLIKILPIHQLKEVNHIIVNKSGLNGFLFTEKCRQVFIPFLHNYMLSVGLIGDPDPGITSMRPNGQKMIMWLGGMSIHNDIYNEIWLSWNALKKCSFKCKKLLMLRFWKTFSFKLNDVTCKLTVSLCIVGLFFQSTTVQPRLRLSFYFL